MFVNRLLSLFRPVVFEPTITVYPDMPKSDIDISILQDHVFCLLEQTRERYVLINMTNGALIIHPSIGMGWRAFIEAEFAKRAPDESIEAFVLNLYHRWQDGYETARAIVTVRRLQDYDHGSLR